MNNNQKYIGNDNYGKSKSEFLEKLSNLNDDKLEDECQHRIWLSAYAANNSRSDYHWQADACYDECVSRNNVKIYEKAYNNAFEK